METQRKESLEEKIKINFSTGFESTAIKNGLGISAKCRGLTIKKCPIVKPDNIDVLRTTHHDKFFKEDFQLLHDMGLRTIRYPIPWHRIEEKKGNYNWQWMDQVMSELKRLNITIIADPLHHTSFPAWLYKGFGDPLFTESYVNFVQLFAERYPWVELFTLFNEPTPTILFCSHDKIWHPFGEGPTCFVAMVKSVAKTVCVLARTLKKLNSKIRFVHVDTCESHQAADDESVPFVRFLNERRFLFLDLILGKINTHYKLWWYLNKNGFTTKDIRWFESNACTINYLGLDYYAHSEHLYNLTGNEIPSPTPKGFKEVAKEYWEHYGRSIPLMLTETNIRGFVSDRISWLKFMLEQYYALLNEGIDIRLFCWFPFIDSTDWDRWVTIPQGNIDPVGLLWLDKDRINRNASELSILYGQLANQEIGFEQLPAYTFLSPLDTQLKGYIAYFMSHWEWKNPKL